MSDGKLFDFPNTFCTNSLLLKKKSNTWPRISTDDKSSSGPDLSERREEFKQKSGVAGCTDKGEVIAQTAPLAVLKQQTYARRRHAQT